MNMIHNTQFLKQLQDTLGQEPDRALSSDLYDLIALYPTYRGAMVTMLTQLLDLPPIPDPLEDVTWLDDIDAFFDIEIGRGTKEAAHTYPHVWWALWDDDECLATYLALRDIHTALQHNELQPFRIRAPQVVNIWSFSCNALNMILHIFQSHQLAFRGTETKQETVLAEREVDLGNGNRTQVTLSICPVSDTLVSVIVHAVPPSIGSVVLTRGEHVFREHFSLDGHATLPAMPASIFLPSDSSSLDVHIELD